MGFLDELVGRRKSWKRKSKSNPPEVYPVYVDDVEVGRAEIPPAPIPRWLTALAIIGAAGTVFTILARIRARRVV